MPEIALAKPEFVSGGDITNYQSQIDRLRTDALFAKCTPSQLARLLGQVHSVTFAAGDALYARGAKAATLFLLESGEVELCCESGRKLALQVPRCGEEAATDLKDRKSVV